MNVHVDRDCCILSGVCTSIAPETFRLDEEGELVVVAEDVPSEHEEDVQTAVDTCPTRALSVTA
jgi:ferredoxin